MYLKIPEGVKLKSDQGRSVLKLERNLYGLKDAGRIWFEHLTDKLEAMGFKATASDPCVLTRGTPMIIFYVDDCILTPLRQHTTTRFHNTGRRHDGIVFGDENRPKHRWCFPHESTLPHRSHHRHGTIDAERQIFQNTGGNRRNSHESRKPRTNERIVALSFCDEHIELFSQLHSSRNGLCRLSMRPVLSRTETKSRAGREKNRPLPPPRQVNKQSGHPVSTEQIPQHPHLRRCILRRGVEYELEQRTIVSVLPLRIRHFIVELSHHLVIQATIGNNSFRHRERICGILASASRRHSAHSSRS